MKAVVDTNVLFAGLLSPFGPPGEIVRMIASGTLRCARCQNPHGIWRSSRQTKVSIQLRTDSGIAGADQDGRIQRGGQSVTGQTSRSHRRAIFGSSHSRRCRLPDYRKHQTFSFGKTSRNGRALTERISRLLPKTNQVTIEGWGLMIFYARATRGLRRPSLDARSGRSFSPHP